MKLVLLFLAIASFYANADTLAGRVVDVVDGATITLIDADHRQHQIRLEGIDAPQAGQPFAQPSRESMSRLVLDKEVLVAWHRRDRQYRMVGKVRVRPADCPTCPMTLDVAQAQLIAGMARWNREDAGEQTPEDQARYAFEENEARVRRIGLWRDAHPVPPGKW